MNFIKRLIITHGLKKQINEKFDYLILINNIKIDDYDKKNIKEFKKQYLKTQIALMDMSNYPFYLKLSDGFNEIMDRFSKLVLLFISSKRRITEKDLITFGKNLSPNQRKMFFKEMEEYFKNESLNEGLK